MKIIAVGMNYAQHNKELGHTQVNREPVIFMKPDSAILKDGKPFFVPDFSNEVHYETEVVVRICRLGKNIAPRFAHRYYDAVTVGIDFTARDLQRKFREAGNPWELCKDSIIRRLSAHSFLWNKPAVTYSNWIFISTSMAAKCSVAIRRICFSR